MTSVVAVGCDSVADNSVVVGSFINNSVVDDGVVGDSFGNSRVVDGDLVIVDSTVNDTVGGDWE